MKSNQEYKNIALAALKGKWAPAVLCAVVYMVIAGFYSVFITLNSTSPEVWTSVVSLLFMYGLMFPLQVGYYCSHRDLVVKGDAFLTRNTFKITFSSWGRNALGMLLMMVFTVLWTFLFIIPGIIKAFAYALTPYILVDNPELSANQAIDLSVKMMKGHKFDMFWLSLSFIGWIFLSIVSLGIGIFWLMPYMTTAMGAFYEDVKAEYESRNSIN
jgi:uncharacterized membrane protein